MAETTKKHKGTLAKKWKRAAKSNGKKTCTVEGCKHAYRAKGYCYKHYQEWRKGKLAHSRFNSCHHEKCTKPQFKNGLCETHWKAKMGIKDEPAATAA